VNISPGRKSLLDKVAVGFPAAGPWCFFIIFGRSGDETIGYWRTERPLQDLAQLLLLLLTGAISNFLNRSLTSGSTLLNALKLERGGLVWVRHGYSTKTSG